MFTLIGYAERLGLACRPVRVDLDDLMELDLPALLHWDLNHFVVLKSVGPTGATIHDPAAGVVKLSRQQISEKFTGFALEFEPAETFEPRKEVETLSIRQLWSRSEGLKRSLFLIALLSLTLQLLLLISPLLTQLVVDNVLARDDFDLLNVLLIGFVMVATGRAIVEALRDNVILRAGSVLSYQIVGNLFRHLTRLPHAFFERRHVGDIVSRFGSTEVLRKSLTEDLVATVIDGATAILTMTLMFFYSPLLAAVVLVTLVIYAIARFFIFIRARIANEEAILAKAEENTHFMETVRGMLSVKVGAREADRVRAWQPKFVRVVNAYGEVGRLKIAQNAARNLLFGIELVVVIYLGAGMILEGGFSVGMLYAFIFYRLEFVDKTTKLGERAVDFAMLRLHLERLSDIALANPEQGGSGGEATRRLRGAVAFCGVSFAYSPSDPEVIRDLDVKIEQGECVAITGPSGGGKTTLSKLILGLLDPTVGSIMIDGIPLDDFGRHALRRQVGAVMQDDQLFAGAIAENIAGGAEVDMDRIRRCAGLAAIAEHIEEMPMRYETLVGDMGAVLSGGQKQRVLLARALYRDPALLLLDEGTSHLDVTTEAAVNRAIRGLGITRIIIAHRLETIMSADRIIYLKGGRLIADMVNEGAPTRERLAALGLPGASV